MKKESKILIKGMVVSGLLLFLVFSTSADTWVLKKDMPTARTFLYPAAAVVDGKVYVIGGYTSSWTGINEEYDPVTNTWATKESMTTARGQMAVCVVDGKIYCIGGEGSGARQKNEVYDPVANSWAPKADIPTNTIRDLHTVLLMGKFMLSEVQAMEIQTGYTIPYLIVGPRVAICQLRDMARDVQCIMGRSM